MNMKKITWSVLSVSFAMLFVFGIVTCAKADIVLDGQVMKGWHPVDMVGEIMIAEQNPDAIVVNEKRIYLVNTSNSKGKQFTTSIMDYKGMHVDRNALKNGVCVYVRIGAALDPDGKKEFLMAKEVYCLPHRMNKKELARHGIPVEPVLPW